MNPGHAGRRAIRVVLALPWFAGPVVGAEEDDLALLRLTREVTALRQAIERLVPPDDLLDSLYLDWSDEPYRRATLACALKTVRILEREVSLRRAGGAALREGQVQEMLAWLRTACTGEKAGPDRGPFAPHRRRVTLDPTSAEPVPALFAFVDRSTMTRLDDWYGDADLLAACGFKVTARADRPYIPTDAWRSLVDHAKALRLGVVHVGDGPGRGSDSPVVAGVSFLQPRTLRDWMLGEARVENSALIDPPRGETWGESMARRALYRGITDGRGPWVSGWRVPQVRSNGSAGFEQVRAAVWAHALDGQRLGVLEGWRDLRDGSFSPYPSLAADPDVVEAVAYAGLDLLYFETIVRAFSPECPVVLFVGEGALHAKDTNRWSPSFAQVAQDLFDANVRFDLLPRAALAEPSRTSKYAVAAALTLPPDESPRLEMVWRFGEPLTERPGDGESLAAYLARLTSGLPDRGPVQPAAGAGNGVYYRSARTADGLVWLALVNVESRPRRVTLTASRGVKLQQAVDSIDGSTLRDVSAGIVLGPWQVRLLALPQ